MRPVLVAIAGGTGSGKTTLARRLVERLPAGAAVLVAEDAYYKDNAASPGFDAARFDFDHPDARDHALLAAHLDVLRRGEAVERPRYSFITHGREPGFHLTEPAPLMVFEGIHLLCSAEVATRFDLRVFVETPADIRFIRRLLRDMKPEAEGGRGRSAWGVASQYLGTVRAAHELHIAPSRASADLVLEDLCCKVEGPDDADLDLLVGQVLEALERRGLWRA